MPSTENTSKLLLVLVSLLLVLPVAEALDVGDTIAFLLGLAVSVIGFCACLGLYARKRNGQQWFQESAQMKWNSKYGLGLRSGVWDWALVLDDFQKPCSRYFCKPLFLCKAAESRLYTVKGICRICLCDSKMVLYCLWLNTVLEKGKNFLNGEGKPQWFTVNVYKWNMWETINKFLNFGFKG